MKIGYAYVLEDSMKTKKYLCLIFVEFFSIHFIFQFILRNKICEKNANTFFMLGGKKTKLQFKN